MEPEQPRQNWFHPADDPELDAALWFSSRIGSKCLLHGYFFGLYVLSDLTGYVSGCPQCLEENLRALRLKRGHASAAMQNLEKEAVRERAFQDRKAREELEVVWDDLYRCDRCGRMGPMEEARYYLPPGVHSSAPYCNDCVEVLRSQS